MRTVVIDGKRYVWREILKLRREQRKQARQYQPTLFQLHDDTRLPEQKTAAGRYHQPTLFEGGQP